MSQSDPDPLDQLNPELAQFFHLSKEDLTPEESRPIFNRLEHTIDRYQINQMINQGGMKRIYEAIDQQCNRLVALAKPQKHMPKVLYESFLREAQLTASLEHPNIAPIYDIAINKTGEPFFVMELIHGEDLECIVEQLKKNNETYIKAYPIEKLLELFVKLCDAVSYAHSKSVLHLDLKPSNVQVGQFGEVLLCDWGLAKILGQEDNENFDDLLFNPDLLNHYTLSGQLKGTPGYMAPEQIESKEKVGKQADIYALGAVLYTILTHHAPIDGSTESILQRTLAGKINSISSTYGNKLIPKSLIAVVEKAMNRNQKDRYQSVEQLQQDVKYYLAGYATKAENAGFLIEGSLFYKRNRLACNLSALAIALLISLMGGVIVVDHLQESRQELQDEYSEYKTKSSFFYFKSENFFLDPVPATQNAIVEFHDIIDNYPDHKSALQNLQHAYFISHQFEKAIESFPPKNIDGIYNLSKLFKDKIDPITNRLPQDEFKNLIELLLKRLTSNRGPTVAERMVAYTFEFPNYDDIRPAITKILLMHRNPKWDGQGFNYNPETQTLRLNERRINNLGDKRAANGGISLLRFMELKTLDISKSKVASFEMLKHLKLEHLNVAHTPIEHLSRTRDFELTKSFTIHKGQFPKDQLKRNLTDRIPIQVIEID